MTSAISVPTEKTRYSFMAKKCFYFEHIYLILHILCQICISIRGNGLCITIYLLSLKLTGYWAHQMSATPFTNCVYSGGSTTVASPIFRKYHYIYGESKGPRIVKFKNKRFLSKYRNPGGRAGLGNFCIEIRAGGRAMTKHKKSTMR